MEPNIKTLAENCLENKWGQSEVIVISQDFTYSCEKYDTSTGDIYISIVNIKEACSFCYDALKRAEIQSEHPIDDKIEIATCEHCLIPRYVCYNKGSEGLLGMLNRLFTKNFEIKKDIIWIINLIRDCLRQLRNFGRIALHTERFISTLEVK